MITTLPSNVKTISGTSVDMRWTTSGDQTRLCVTCSNSSAESAIVGTAVRAPSAGQSAYPKSHLFTHTHTHTHTHV